MRRVGTVTGAVTAARCFLVWVLGCGFVWSGDAPHRVASLAPSVTETVLALGLEERLVSRTRWCPVVAGDVREFPDFVQPGIETILGLKPDLVIVSDPTTEDAVRAMVRAGLRVERWSTRGVGSVLGNLERAGVVLGAADRGVAVSREVRRQLEQVEVAVSGRRRPRAALFFGTDTAFAAGRASFAGELLERAGGENVAERDGEAWPMLNEEHLLSWNPEVMILALGDEASELDAARELIRNWTRDPLWGRVAAVRQGRVAAVTGSLLMIPGPRIGRAAEALAAILHPGACPGPVPTETHDDLLSTRAPGNVPP